MTRFRRFAPLLALALAPLTVDAQPAAGPGRTLRLEEGQASPPAKIADFAWLAGYWQGEGLGGQCEEVWGKPNLDRMHGFFSLAQGGKPVFSEAMMLVEHQGSVELRLKHFRPDFVGWEQKDKFVTFELVKVAPGEAHFSGLAFRRDGDSLAIHLRLKQDDGTVKEEAFTFRRTSF